MTDTTYFFDTYALSEILNGVETYAEYSKISGITTIFNIAELNWLLKRKISEQEADTMTMNAVPFVIPVEISDIKQAMTFRKKHKHMSIPDCIGYIISLRYKIPFLTGDEDFKHLPNVQFVNTRTGEKHKN